MKKYYQYFVKSKQYIYIFQKRIIIGIILLTAFSIGYLQYKNRYCYNNNITKTSLYWNEINTKFNKKIINDSDIKSAVQFSQKNKNCYGIFLLLKIASYHVSKKNYSEAEKELKMAIKNSKDINLKSILKINLARIYIQQKNTKNAKKILKNIKETQWSPFIYNILGDIEIITKNNKNIANQLYNKALNLNTSPILEKLLHAKISNLSIQ
ncbi:MAG: ancillary SecYEG translocon subunit [Candidatus Westeberhardia cardiocondylae]|nr:ancillary SecYEG translocon subunit [Candidatus Westeberhardia cardiocondylae]